MFTARSLLVVLAVSGTTLVAGPVHGGPFDPNGFGCAFVATSPDANNPSIHAGVIKAGPVTVYGAVSMSITCKLQTGTSTDSPTVPAIAIRTWSASGPVVAGADLLTYVAPPGSTEYICTYLTWAYGNGATGSLSTGCYIDGWTRALT